MRLHIIPRRLDTRLGADDHHLVGCLVDAESDDLGLLLQLLEVAPIAPDQPSHLLGLHWDALGDELEHVTRSVERLLRRPIDDDARAGGIDLDAIDAGDAFGVGHVLAPLAHHEPHQALVHVKVKAEACLKPLTLIGELGREALTLLLEPRHVVHVLAVELEEHLGAGDVLLRADDLDARLLGVNGHGDHLGL